MKRLVASGAVHLSEITHRVLNDADFFDSLLGDLSIQVTEMFRDPLFFLALREQVLPERADRPVLKIWHAGCATGEEVYSMAILIKEAGLLNKTTIFATDINGTAITRAKEGVYSLEQLQKSTVLYQKSGGTGSFGDNYRAKYDSAIISAELKHMAETSLPFS